MNRGTLNEIGSRRSPDGFTLLEVVIVVSVIALFIGLAVPRLPDVAGMRIHRNARKVSMMLQLARTRAVSLRRYYRMDVDLDTSGVSVSYFGPEGTYIPDDEVRQFSLREGFIADVVNSSEGKVLEGTGWVRISPRGYIQPSLIHIKDEQGRVLTVAPSPVSGRVQIQEGYTDLATRLGPLWPDER
ncbi:MAG: prepilin-type N-terminal cleavage/methylation domain-containing protein [bacterium]|nr:prepilin-type N-terminal cleavage/methylation domain-containing protein [bacterium]